MWGEAPGAPWALEDLTLYVTHYYRSVVHALSPVGFRMARVRVRAWAYFGMGVAQMMSPLENESTDARNANDYSYGDRGNVVNVENATDFRIEECDLIGTWTVIEAHNSSYGVVSRNALGAGSHGCHGFISVDHVIFEHNRCVGLLQGARHYLKYAYHLWEGYNTNRISWGGSREAMTYDNPGNSFLGRFEAQRALQGGRALVRLAGNFSRFDDTRDGRQHALVVVDGAGALQRRFVLALADVAGAAAARRSVRAGRARGRATAAPRRATSSRCSCTRARRCTCAARSRTRARSVLRRLHRLRCGRERVRRMGPVADVGPVAAPSARRPRRDRALRVQWLQRGARGPRSTTT